ncbi:MAG: glycoside hydrolase family 2 TIM barrel-domain containing protein [Anaerolineae bacterium]|nr:glycoside hydrolase family 2 TIM barrel-domain containing protein [Anaerolineae bacterium]
MVQADGSVRSFVKDIPSGGQMPIPSNWQLQGLESFNGRVRFSRSFVCDPLPLGQRAFLVFRGVDYFAEVTLNGRFIGRHEGYFQPFEFEVTHVLREGENQLQVDVDCPAEEPGTVWPDHKWLIKGILSHWDARPGSWDLQRGQEKNSGGIWGDVYLDIRSHTFVRHVKATTALVPQKASTDMFVMSSRAEGVQAIVRLDIEVDSWQGGTFALHVELGNIAKTSMVDLPSGRSQVTTTLSVPDPSLWWPWDLGTPYLYTLTVRLMEQDRILSEWQRPYGLRELALDHHTGEWRVNGKRFFVRGTNVVPTLWLSEYTPERIARDIALLKAAHVNGVRVCVHINREEFYDACDREGIIVWQDFPLQWGYTEDPRFMDEAVRQVRDMIRHLYNHPCIAVWCLQNESSFHNKMILNPVLALVAQAEDASRYVRATSEFEEHAYPGWYYGHLRDYLTLPGAPIVTEFGAQALPAATEVREMEGGDQWPPNWDGLAYHDFQYDQTFHVAGIQMGDSLEAFVGHSQQYQAELLKFAIEQYRQHKYERVGGIFQFMFMDCWPSITWSVVSYYRVPKKGYYALQKAYQPILIGADIQREKVLVGTDRGAHPRPLWLPLWIVNDRHECLEACTYEVRLVADNQEVCRVTGLADTIPADGFIRLPPVRINVPENMPLGPCSVELTLYREGEVISRNSYQIEWVGIPR